MKIVRNLSGENDVSTAVVEVGEHEVADIDEMLRLLDDVHSDYALTIRFVAAGDPPAVKTVGHHEFAVQTPTPRELDALRQHKRYYEVRIRHAAS